MPSRRWAKTAVGVAATLAVLGSGCAKKSIASGAGGTTPAAVGTTPAATDSGGTSGYGGYGGRGDYGGGNGSPSSPAGAGKGTIVQQGAGGMLAFSPATLSVKHGATIMIRNVSTDTAHTFTITGKGIDITNAPGKSQSVAVDLPPGTYQFICRFHQSYGMTGTLTVTV